MAKYLDLKGLTTFWNKIKERLSAKQDALAFDPSNAYDKTTNPVATVSTVDSKITENKEVSAFWLPTIQDRAEKDEQYYYFEPILNDSYNKIIDDFNKKKIVVLCSCGEPRQFIVNSVGNSTRSGILAGFVSYPYIYYLNITSEITTDELGNKVHEVLTYRTHLESKLGEAIGTANSASLIAKEALGKVNAFYDEDNNKLVEGTLSEENKLATVDTVKNFITGDFPYLQKATKTYYQAAAYYGVKFATTTVTSASSTSYGVFYFTYLQIANRIGAIGETTNQNTRPLTGTIQIFQRTNGSAVTTNISARITINQGDFIGNLKIYYKANGTSVDWYLVKTRTDNYVRWGVRQESTNGTVNDLDLTPVTSLEGLTEINATYKYPMFAGTASGVGSSVQPVYVDSVGRVTACALPDTDSFSGTASTVLVTNNNLTITLSKMTYNVVYTLLLYLSIEGKNISLQNDTNSNITLYYATGSGYTSTTCDATKTRVMTPLTSNKKSIAHLVRTGPGSVYCYY